jgi:hypothetical protein
MTTRVEIHRVICRELGGPKTHDHTACENAANAVHEAFFSEQR